MVLRYIPQNFIVIIQSTVFFEYLLFWIHLNSLEFLFISGFNFICLYLHFFSAPPELTIAPKNLTLKEKVDAFFTCKASAYPTNITYRYRLHCFLDDQYVFRLVSRFHSLCIMSYSLRIFSHFRMVSFSGYFHLMLELATGFKRSFY